MAARLSMFGMLVIVALAALPQRASVHAEPPAPLAVVVGQTTKLSEISLATLRSVFRSEPTNAPDGKRFVPLNAPLKSYERELFDRKVMGLAPDEVAQFWITRRIRDEGLPPRTLPSVDLGLRVVASYPGAITYVSAKIVKGVKVLKVDGKLPYEAGYLLAGP